MRRVLAIIAAALAVGVSLPLLDLEPASATAPVYSPYAPPPVNVLPSSVAHVGTAVSPLSQTRMAGLMYAAQPTRDYWGAVAVRNAGGALTTRQSAVITNVQTSSRIPTGGFMQLAKTAGGAAVGFMAADAAVMIGVGALDLVWSDRAGTVCRNVGNDPLGSFVALAASADCSAFRLEPGATLVPNEGINGGWSVRIVDASGRVYSYRGTAQDPREPNVAVYYWCWNSSTTIPSSGATVWARDPASRETVQVNMRRDDPTAIHSCGGAPAIFTPLPHIIRFPTAGLLRNFDPMSLHWSPTNPNQNPQWNVPQFQDPNPTRTLQCVILGSNGNTYRGATVSFTEEDDVFPSPSCPSLPEGVIPSESWIDLATPGQGVERLAHQLTNPDVVRNWNTYPECRDFSCATELWKEQTNCHVDPVPCLNWYENPNRESEFSCKHGTRVVDLAECTIYADPFRSPTGTKEGTKPDSLSDPKTGAPMTSPFPRGADPFYSTAPLSTGTGQCFPSGWAVFNPVEWVMRPVQCALQWAFVPRADVQTQVQTQLALATEGTALALAATTLPGLVAPFAAGGSGCSGPPWHIDAFGVSETFYPFSACDEPVAGAASVVRIFLSVTIMLLTLVSVTRYIGASIGFVGFSLSTVADAKQADADASKRVKT